MERLTEKVSGCNQIIKCGNDLCKETCEEWSCDFCPISEAIDKLADYEDAEEQGLLLRLPCKEVYSSSGDTVYYIFDYEIVECINCGVSMDCEGKLWIALACDEHIFPYRNPDPEHDLDPTDWCMNTTSVSVDEWNKSVFLTKEEAEQALKRMESE